MPRKMREVSAAISVTESAPRRERRKNAWGFLSDSAYMTLPLAVNWSRVIAAQLLFAFNCAVIQRSNWEITGVTKKSSVARVVMTVRQYWPQCLAYSSEP